MIPPVRRWRVRVVETETEGERILFMDGPTKTLVRIGFRLDYPGFWGREIKISLAPLAKK